MSEIKFKVNGKKCVVDSTLPRDTTLNAYLRYELELHGTKAMCHQGGCGACIVMVRAKRSTSGVVETFHVNSCLILVFSCHGWEITTVEGVGNRVDGYSDVQKRMAAFNATQCGYCTPGWVMSLTSLKDRNLTMAQMEKSFGSNTCRCTGFRPLMEVVKSFATDASPHLCQKIKDIEDIATCKKDNQCSNRKCSLEGDDEWCIVKYDALKIKEDFDSNITIDFGNDNLYFKVKTEDDIFDILNKYGFDSYMLIDGDTSKGIIEIDEYPKLIINISEVNTLKTYSFDQNFILGANITLEDCITIFTDTSKTKVEFSYLSEFAKHLELVAHIPVRKIASLAGNLMIKHRRKTFQSDIFLLMESVGTVMTVRDKNGQKETLTMAQFLNTDMKGKLITNLILPPLSNSHIFRSYKIMPRNQNALALVNAAFLLKINNNTKLLEAITIVYGNISSSFIRANNTENYLKNKNLFNNDVIQGAIKVLLTEINPVARPPEPSPECRKKLAIGLFYKFILSIAPINQIRADFRSGRTIIERPVSKAAQDYQTDEKLYPLNQALPKYEADIQSAGEAQYANDIPSSKSDVFGALVLATIHNGEIDSIDATEVLKVDGVVTVLTAKDIPGKNSFIQPNIQFMSGEDEEILSSGKITYYSQPVAILVAKTEYLAKKMAKKVKVTYKNISTSDAVITIEQAKRDSSRYTPSDFNITPTSRGDDVKKVITGVVECPSQYLYCIEPFTCTVVPVDKGLEVYCATQWIDLTQLAISQSCNMKESDVTVKVRRVGGAFGAKTSRSAMIACASALVAKKLGVPCRFILPLDTNLTAIGKRYSNRCEYEVGVNDSGKIQYLESTFVCNAGVSLNESFIPFVVGGFTNCYDKSNMSLKVGTVKTDLPSNTFARAPGTLEAITSIEHIIEHIAFEIQKDPTQVRLDNMRSEDNELPNMIDVLKEKSGYNNRVEEIKNFNNANRWMKKAIQISVTNFPIIYFYNFTGVVSIYRGDGTVTVVTGGIEMGQGLNTKAAQVAAYILGIPIEKVSVLPSTSYTSPNNQTSGGSIASECVCYATMKACQMLNERLAPIKASMPNGTWEDIVFEAGKQQVELQASYMMTDREEDLKSYIAYVVAIIEVQLDVITGRFELIRADILEDVGVSANPNIDIGQVEGAYVQTLGYYLTEKLVYEPSNGKLLTDSSLNYHVPLCNDIPIEFNVNLRYNSKNPVGVLGSKAVGEMAVGTAHGVTHALRRAIYESRAESGYDTTKWIDISMPYDTETILKALDVKYEEFILS